MKWSSLSRRTRNRLFFAAIFVVAALGIATTVDSHFFAPGRSLAAMKAIQSDKRIIDVHEHIQSLNEVQKMIAAMDAVGIQKTVLMGSSWFTLTLNQKVGFTRYDENNEELLRICKQYPGRFEAWPTVNPLDPEKLDKFKNLVGRGASGLKLYLGHGFKIKATDKYMFHTVPINDETMLPLYKYCEDNFIPVCLHVNPSPKTAPGFAEEFVSVLQKFPNLKLVCPHFMLSSEMSNRLKELLDTFPNLYTDVSFGYDDYFKEGLHRISKNPAKFQRLFAQYPDRFFFAADLVITNEEVKTQEWITSQYKAYIDMLSKQTYTTPMLRDEVLYGVALPPALLERILYKNFEKFLTLKPTNTKAGSVNWKRMRSTVDENAPKRPRRS
jgi:predicted TIM-barrel fold metal-dependent hydrolase